MAKLYQVFVGCPFAKEIRAVYDHLKKDVEATTPLSLVLADTVGLSSSDYLLEHITELIRDSAGCIFDATGANPNVSLEVGIAHTVPVDFILTLKTRKVFAKKEPEGAAREVRSIISDLQGKSRIEYKAYKKLKHQLDTRYLGELPYMKRWKSFVSGHKDMASYALQLFADLRTSGRTTGARVQAYLEGSGFSTSDVTAALVSSKLVSVKRGRDGGIFYATK